MGSLGDGRWGEVERWWRGECGRGTGEVYIRLVKEVWMVIVRLRRRPLEAVTGVAESRTSAEMLLVQPMSCAVLALPKISPYHFAHTSIHKTRAHGRGLRNSASTVRKRRLSSVDEAGRQYGEII